MTKAERLQIGIELLEIALIPLFLEYHGYYDATEPFKSITKNEGLKKTDKKISLVQELENEIFSFYPNTTDPIRWSLRTRLGEEAILKLKKGYLLLVYQFLLRK